MPDSHKALLSQVVLHYSVHLPYRNALEINLAMIGGEQCNQLYTLSRPIGCVKELMSLDLGFRTIAPQCQEVKIFNDELDPVDFGPAHAEGMMHGG